MRDFDPTASEYISSGFTTISRPGGPLYDIGSIVGSLAGPLIGGLLGSDSADSAADAQTTAAAQSDATQRYQYDTTRADNAPFRDTGVQANNRLAYVMGLAPGSSSAPAGSGAGGMTAEQLRAELLGQYTTTAAPNPADGANWTRDNDNQYYTPQPGAQTIDETGLQSAIQARMSQQSQQTQQTQAAQSNDPSFGSLSRNFTAADMGADPVYQSGLKFGLDEGSKGINRQAAAGGSMLSGATLKALTRFGNDYGSTKANESYNRFNTNNNQQYNRLAGLSGAGQQATNQVSAAGSRMADNISQSQQGVGNARGSAYLTQGNAWQNAINGGVSAWNNSNNSPSPVTFDGTGAWRP
jgi:hypothetical protein